LVAAWWEEVVPRAVSRSLGCPSWLVVRIVMLLRHGLKLEQAFKSGDPQNMLKEVNNDCKRHKK
jgi:hypothetical protein